VPFGCLRFDYKSWEAGDLRDAAEK